MKYLHKISKQLNEIFHRPVDVLFRFIPLGLEKHDIGFAVEIRITVYTNTQQHSYSKRIPEIPGVDDEYFFECFLETAQLEITKMIAGDNQ